MIDRPSPGGFTGLLIAGAGPAVAATFTNPLDVARVNMQLNGEGGGVAAHRNTFACMRSIFVEHGMVGLQRGLTTAYFREFIQNVPRLGLFEPLMAVYRKADGTHGNGEVNSFGARLFAGASCGIIGGVFSNPGEIVKARVQSGRYTYGHPYNPASPFLGLASMARAEGVLSWYKGADASAARCLVGTSSQMLTASYVLDMIQGTAWYQQGSSSSGSGSSGGGERHSSTSTSTSTSSTFLQLSPRAKFAAAHCLSGLASGCVLSCAMQPFDTARTRLYSQPTNPDGTGTLYRTGVTGLFDAMRKTFRLEGVRGLYKGLTGNIVRQGPHQALAFLIMSQFKQLHGHTVARPREVDALWGQLLQHESENAKNSGERELDDDGRVVGVGAIKDLLRGRRHYATEKTERHRRQRTVPVNGRELEREEELERSARCMLAHADADGNGALSRRDFEALVRDVEFVVRENVVDHWARCGGCGVP